MYASYAERLRRKKWKDVNEFAEEVYAILSNRSLPLSHAGPVKLTQPVTGEPPLSIVNSQEGDTVIQIKPRPTDPFSPQALQEILDYILENGAITPPPAAGAPPPPKEPAAATFAGTIVSGSGDTYQVELKGGGTVEAKVIQIDAGEVVPKGTGVIVVKQSGSGSGGVLGGTSGGYWFQPPVWL